jgi:hypothetical protein
LPTRRSHKLNKSSEGEGVVDKGIVAKGE